MPKHALKVDIPAILEVFKRGLFHDPEVVIREMLFNAHDACVLRRAEDPTYTDLRIDVSRDHPHGTLAFRDNGAGMTAHELHQHMSTIGGSSKRLMQKVGLEEPLSLIGGFGIGSFAAASIADRVEIFTRSCRPGSAALKWVYEGGAEYSIEEADERDIGTTVVLHLRKEYSDLLRGDRIQRVLEKYAAAISTRVYLDGEAISPRHGTVYPAQETVTPYRISPGRLRVVIRTPSPTDSSIDLLSGEPTDFAARRRTWLQYRESAGSLRFDFNGRWSVRDLAALLGILESIYRRLTSVLFVASHLEAQDLNEITSQLTQRRDTPTNPEELWVDWTTRASRPLRINRIQLASPGFMELIGSLNPLKLMADFITNWRHENTVRDQNRRQADLECLKVRAGIAQKLLEIELDVRSKAPHHELVEKYLTYTLGGTVVMLEDIAKDIRVARIESRPVEQVESDSLSPS